MWAIPGVREPSLQSILVDPAVFHDDIDCVDAALARLGIEIFRVGTKHGDVFERVTVNDQYMGTNPSQQFLRYRSFVYANSCALPGRKDRRDDRQENRDDKQDCRQEEGRVGHDRRE